MAEQDSASTARMIVDANRERAALYARFGYSEEQMQQRQSVRSCGTCVHGPVDISRKPCRGCLGTHTAPNWEDKLQRTPPGPTHMPLTPRPEKELSMRADATPSAPDILHKAAEIMEERGKQYDRDGQFSGGERSMIRTVTAFNAITGQQMTEAQGWLFMQVLKDVRQWQAPTYHADSAEDGVAYSALKAECLARGGAK